MEEIFYVLLSLFGCFVGGELIINLNSSGGGNNVIGYIGVEYCCIEVFMEGQFVNFNKWVLFLLVVEMF